jgi:hypothetical protein
MDATRYLLTDRPAPSQLSIVRQVMVPDYLLKWTETPDLEEARVA